jgi:hypothetical protein
MTNNVAGVVVYPWDVSSAEPEKRPFYLSPRKQRTLLAVVGVVAAVGAAAILIVFFSNTGDATETFSSEPAQTFTPPKPAAVDPQAKRVAGTFIKTAVLRHDIGTSYDITHPELLQGMTRKQWLTGDIPVVPYSTPALDFVSFKVDHSFENEIVLEVLLVPKGGTAKPASFFIGLKKTDGGKGPWKVFYWAPSYRPAVPDPG